MRAIKAVLIIICLFAIAPPAIATTWYEKEFTCPIGGEKFTALLMGSNYSIGQRPDGKPTGGPAPGPLIECPDNGLILLQEDFTDAQKAILAKAIASEEYQQMRKEDTPYRRAWWLRKKLDHPPLDLVFALYFASWETDENPARKRRYQNDFARAAMALERTQDNHISWFWLNIRALNALRETQQWDDAKKQLNAINQPELFPKEDEDAEGADSLIAGLQNLIDEGNSVSMPTNLLSAHIAAERCLDQFDTLSTSEKQACDTPDYKEVQSNILKHREQ